MPFASERETAVATGAAEPTTPDEAHAAVWAHAHDLCAETHGANAAPNFFVEDAGKALMAKLEAAHGSPVADLLKIVRAECKLPEPTDAVEAEA